MARDLEWRKKEPSLDDIINKYPELPRSFILKVDVYRRGVLFSENALKLADPDVHQLNKDGIPDGLTLNDGSFLVGVYYNFAEAQRDPYLVDEIDGKAYITDEGKKLAEIEYWEKPDFYNKKASNGIPLSFYATARPQRLDIQLNAYCHFWDKPGEGCKYCSWTPEYKLKGCTEERKNDKYVDEAIREAFKQTGRFSAVMMTGGSAVCIPEMTL